MTLAAEPESMAMWRNRAHSARAFGAGIERLNHVRDGHQQSLSPSSARKKVVATVINGPHQHSVNWRKRALPLGGETRH